MCDSHAIYVPVFVEAVAGQKYILFNFFFLRDFIFKKTLFEKFQYLKQERALLLTVPQC